MLRLLVCAGLVFCAGAVLAQDKEKGEGKPKTCKVAGVITKVSADAHHFIVKGADNKLRHVCCSRECKITSGAKKLTCKDLKKGMRVNVAGHEACHCEAATDKAVGMVCKVKGQVTQVSADKHHFTVKDPNGRLRHVCCGRGCKITAGTKTITCKDVKVGMKVSLSGHEACHCETVRVLPAAVKDK